MYAGRYTSIYVVVYMCQLPILLYADKSSPDRHVGLWFVRSPEPIVAPPGDEVVFECSLNVGSESVRWKHNSQFLPPDTSPGTRPLTAANRLVKDIDQKQAGDYQCIAWYGASALASTIGRLTLAELKPFPPASSRHFTVTAGNNVAIDCPAPVSYPPAVIQYYFNNISLSESSTMLITTNSLILHNVTSRHSGRYSCSATNYITVQTVHSPAVTTLTVVNPQQPAPPRFLYTPQSLYVVQVGGNVSLECLGVGTPPPTVTWRRGDGLPRDRHYQVTGALRLYNLQPGDSGAYMCHLNNGVSPAITHQVILQVQEPPVVTREPSNSVVEEGGSVELECEVTGRPTPNITWLLNGEPLDNDTHAHVRGNRVEIVDVEKRHAGVLQCLAVNPLGSVYGAALLQVSPRQVSPQDPPHPESSEGVSLLPPLPAPGRTHPKKDHTRKGKGRRKDKKHKGTAVMIPPTRPNITRLSDRSVMVRWSVPPNDGLPIQFFKVQYRELGVRGRGSRWMTSNEDIPSHIRSYEVDNLDTDHTYRFRIAAVYSNNDNKLGPNSARFHLHRGLPNNRTPLSPPSLTQTEAISPSAIKIQWQYLNSVLAPVDGFYVYYRMTSSAGDYVKATVEGENTRAFIITHLLPDTAYDIKLQAFTVGAASDFSAILTHKTLKDLNATVPSVVLAVDTKREEPPTTQMVVVVAAVVAGLTLLTLVLAALCFCKQRSPSLHASGESEECDKVGRGEAGLTIQQLSSELPINGFAHSHNGKVNGFVPHSHPHPHPHINITNNPLAEPHQDKNVMEMSYMTSQNNNCSAESSGGVEGEETWRGRGSGENYV